MAFIPFRLTLIIIINKRHLFGLFHIYIVTLGESIYDQKPPNPKKIDTKGFLTDSGRICHVK